MRLSIYSRRINGVIQNPTIGAVRTMYNAQTSVGTLNTTVLTTGALSVGEKNVAIAYLVLMGRSPDRAGLSYWVNQVGSNASISTAVDTLFGALNGSDIIDAAPYVQIALVYHHLMGKTQEEDPAGQAYWTSQVNSGISLGAVTEAIVTVVIGVSSYAANTMKNRFLVLESICRIQKDQNFDLSVSDSRSAVLRVDGVLSSYTEAMIDVERLLIARTASTPLSWGKAWTYTSLAAVGRLYDNTSVIQVRNVVWYNRDGNMMLAKFYLPPNFTSYASHHVVMALHGGGWRQGYPEVIYNYCTALATNISPSYVVAAPTYRLTPYGVTSPAPEHDAVDFYNLLNAATFIRKGFAPAIFGESSGGHLACYVGATQNVPRVFALYPPINLTGNPAVSAGLDAYVDYYVNTPALQSAASVDLLWTGSRTTQFQLWHGTGDTFVPQAQSGLLDTVAGANCSVTYKAGEGHGFTSQTRTEVISAARTFFNT